MQFPSIDRNPNLRPASVDVATDTSNSPSVINKINPALQANEGEPVYTSVSDPARRGSEAATSPKDWTIHRPAPEKVEDPPPKPMYQLLMEHIKSMWTAGASAIQIEQVGNQLTPPLQVPPTEAPGTLAKEVLVYEPSKITKNEKL